MLFDLHIHTVRYSRCSILNPRDLVLRAKRIGLDGLAITEHDRCWSLQELAELKEETGVDDFILLRGTEIEREWKHFLIFNYPHDIGRSTPTEEVIDEVAHEGGVVILAHPFRYGRLLALSLEELRDLFAPFDAVEILTPQHSNHENQKALLFQQSLQMVGIGGSDSHDVDQVGKCVTYVSNPIRDEKDLAQSIRDGNCLPLFGHQSLEGFAAEPRARSLI